MKYFCLCIFYTLLLFICSCASGLKNLDAEWSKENIQISNMIGTKTYDGLTKEKAMNAMAIAFQRLDVIVENSDFRTGLLMASAQAPKPLTYEEFDVVVEVENPRAKSHSVLFTWTRLRDFNTRFNCMCLETGEGVQISIRGKLESKNHDPNFIPISEFPPKGLEMAYNKIWNEFEKIVFIQSKTLK